jgi:hypothetical protein
MKNILSRVFISISSAFFELGVYFHKERRKPIDFNNLRKYQKCDCGFFIKSEVIDNDKIYGLFANSQIGFFYKEYVFEDEISNLFASEKEITEIKQYLIDKIFECHEHIEKLEKNEIQPSLPN